MKLHLINVVTDGREEETGTCELCFDTTWTNNPVFEFKDENGNKFSVDGYYWDWGDYWEVEIPNVIDFAAWLDKQDIDEDQVAILRNYEARAYGVLEDLVDRYLDYKFELDHPFPTVKDADGNIIKRNDTLYRKGMIPRYLYIDWDESKGLYVAEGFEGRKKTTYELHDGAKIPNVRIAKEGEIK